MKRLLTMLFAFLVLYGPVAASAEGPKILVIPKGVRVQYWKWVKQGALDAGRDRSAEVVFRGPWASDDYQAQIGILKKGLEEGVDAIVIAPNHTVHSATLLAQAVQQGVIVVLIDSDMEFEDRVSLVASDNYLAGRLGAEFLFSLMGGKGTALLLRYVKDNASTLAREKGFMDAAAKLSPALTVVEYGEAGVNTGAAYRHVMDALADHPEISGIFSTGESTSVGAIRALREMHLNGMVNMVGFDYTQDIHEALADGTLNGVVVQSPYQIGYQGVMAACDALEGKPVEKRIVTQTTIVKEPKSDLITIE